MDHGTGWPGLLRCAGSGHGPGRRILDSGRRSLRPRGDRHFRRRRSAAGRHGGRFIACPRTGARTRLGPRSPGAGAHSDHHGVCLGAGCRPAPPHAGAALPSGRCRWPSGPVCFRPRPARRPCRLARVCRQCQRARPQHDRAADAAAGTRSARPDPGAGADGGGKTRYFRLQTRSGPSRPPGGCRSGGLRRLRGRPVPGHAGGRGSRRAAIR